MMWPFLAHKELQVSNDVIVIVVITMSWWPDLLDKGSFCPYIACSIMYPVHVHNWSLLHTLPLHPTSKLNYKEGMAVIKMTKTRVILMVTDTRRHPCSCLLLIITT